MACSIVSTTRPVVAASCTSERGAREVRLDFSFLDSSDGFVVEVLHTGTISHPTIKGTVRGLPGGLKNRGKLVPGTAISSSRGKIKAIEGLRTIVQVIFFAGLAKITLDLVQHVPGFGAEVNKVTYAFATFFALQLCFAVWDLLRLRRRYPRSLHSELLD